MAVRFAQLSAERQELHWPRFLRRRGFAFRFLSTCILFFNRVRVATFRHRGFRLSRSIASLWLFLGCIAVLRQHVVRLTICSVLGIVCVTSIIISMTIIEGSVGPVCFLIVLPPVRVRVILFDPFCILCKKYPASRLYSSPLHRARSISTLPDSFESHLPAKLELAAQQQIVLHQRL